MGASKDRFVKGSEPAKVYWRRRAIVAAVALALVLVVVLALKTLGGGSSSAEGRAVSEPGEWVEPSIDTTLKRPYISPTPEPEPSSEEPTTEPAVPACPEDELMLQVVAAFDEVRSGVSVPVSVLVASGAEGACTADLGLVAVELAAGEDLVFASDHCAEAEERSVELEQGAGQTVELEFDGLASEPGCEGERRALPAGDYDMRARLGAAVSQPSTLTLT